MLNSLLIAILGILALMLGWVAIQSVWRKSFSEYIEEEDVLAERRSCGNCGCTTACKTKNQQLETSN